MLAGVPMVVSDIEPLLEATENGKYAEVFPVGDAGVLSETISGLLGDPNRRVDLAEKARPFAQDNFSIDAHLRVLKELYQSIR